MVEATKTLQKRQAVGSELEVTYDLTNLANGETITTPLRAINSVAGINRVTADKPFACTMSGGTATAVISTTTDEYRVTFKGKY